MNTWFESTHVENAALPAGPGPGTNEATSCFYLALASRGGAAA